jgi:hypothetical protein
MMLVSDYHNSGNRLAFCCCVANELNKDGRRSQIVPFAHTLECCARTDCISNFKLQIQVKLVSQVKLQGLFSEGGVISAWKPKVRCFRRVSTVRPLFQLVTIRKSENCMRVGKICLIRGSRTPLETPQEFVEALFAMLVSSFQIDGSSWVFVISTHRRCMSADS